LAVPAPDPRAHTLRNVLEEISPELEGSFEQAPWSVGDVAEHQRVRTPSRQREVVDDEVIG